MKKTLGILILLILSISSKTSWALSSNLLKALNSKMSGNWLDKDGAHREITVVYEAQIQHWTANITILSADGRMALKGQGELSDPGIINGQLWFRFINMRKLIDTLDPQLAAYRGQLVLYFTGDPLHVVRVVLNLFGEDNSAHASMEGVPVLTYNDPILTGAPREEKEGEEK